MRVQAGDDGGIARIFTLDMGEPIGGTRQHATLLRRNCLTGFMAIMLESVFSETDRGTGGCSNGRFRRWKPDGWIYEKIQQAAKKIRLERKRKNSMLTQYTLKCRTQCVQGKGCFDAD